MPRRNSSFSCVMSNPTMLNLKKNRVDDLICSSVRTAHRRCCVTACSARVTPINQVLCCPCWATAFIWHWGTRRLRCLKKYIYFSADGRRVLALLIKADRLTDCTAAEGDHPVLWIFHTGRARSSLIHRDEWCHMYQARNKTHQGRVLVNFKQDIFF